MATNMEKFLPFTNSQGINVIFKNGKTRVIVGIGKVGKFVYPDTENVLCACSITQYTEYIANI